MAGLFNDLCVLGVFLMVGWALREFCPLFRKIFLPASVIGGVVALLGGQQVFNLWVVPKSFGSYSGTLIIFIMACLVWGVNFDRQKLEGYLDYFLVVNSIRFSQVALGALTGIILRMFWTNLPLGWGTMGVSAYFNGHGNAAAFGSVFEQLGMGKDNLGLGMIMATFGLICAVTIGMIMVNVGVRKNWATYITKDTAIKRNAEKSLLSKEQQTSIGTARISSDAMNPLAFQFAILVTVCFVGATAVKFVGRYVPFVGKMSSMLHGIFGAIILWPIASKLGFGAYVDKKTCSTMSGFCLEILILASVATMNLKLVSMFIVPLLIHMVVIVAATWFICFVFAPKVIQHEWFEKALMMFGMATGAVPSGLTLVRAADPDNKSTVAEAHGVAAGVVTPMIFWMPAVLPALAINMPYAEVLLGLAVYCVLAGAAWVLFRKKVKALGR